MAQEGVKAGISLFCFVLLLFQGNFIFIFSLQDSGKEFIIKMDKINSFSGTTREERRTDMKRLEDYVLSIPDFPEPGIIFRDITTILSDADGLTLAIDGLQDAVKDLDFDVVVGAEARGFIFGMPVAYNLHKPFIPVRKKGKLPRETISETYALEYGVASIEIHKDAIEPGQKVVLVDDLLATGGTLRAAARLIERLGGEVVRILVVMELAGLEGRKVLDGYDVSTLISYEGK